MFVAISKYTKSLADVDVHRAAHKEYLQQCFNAGKLLVSGRQNPPEGGVIISKDVTAQEFRDIIANDPFSQAGVAIYTITEFEPGFVDAVLHNLMK